MKIFNKLLVLLALLIFQTSVSAESIKITYIHNDAIGSPVAASDKDGTRVVDERYWPYGEKRYSDATLSEAKLGYTGHRSEDGLGLVYMGARYYDPVVGRFMGFDPVGFIEDSPESFNRYAYANNNPYRYVDPDGRLPFLIPVVVWIVKEAGGALIEHYTGIPASTKGLVKAGTKLVLNKQVKRSVTKSGTKPLKEQAADLIPQNANRNRVTLRSPSQKMEVDLAGREHGGIPTPHTKVSPRNYKAPNQPAYNTKNSPVRPATQQDIRTVRRYLERQGR